MNLLARVWGRLKPALPGALDLHLYGGGALIVWGTWRVSMTVALVVAGVFLTALGIWQMLRAERVANR